MRIKIGKAQKHFRFAAREQSLNGERLSRLCRLCRADQGFGGKTVWFDSVGQRAPIVAYALDEAASRNFPAIDSNAIRNGTPFTCSGKPGINLSAAAEYFYVGRF